MFIYVNNFQAISAASLIAMGINFDIYDVTGGTFLKTPIERDYYYYSDDICLWTYSDPTRYFKSTRGLRNCLLTYNNITLSAR